jgi:hypothetical protein
VTADVQVSSARQSNAEVWPIRDANALLGRSGGKQNFYRSNEMHDRTQLRLAILVGAFAFVASLPTIRGFAISPAAESQAAGGNSSQSSGQPVADIHPATLTITLQTRGTDGIPLTQEESIDSRRIGIVVVDPWNFHWCKTATMRVDALIPRINRTLDAGRELGMTVMLCPSDVVDNYVGWPQREIVLAMEKRPEPHLLEIQCPAPPDGGGCACGHDRCETNYGWDGMHPDLRIGPDDLIPDTLQEVWTICQDRELTHLIYAGVHTQVCLLGKPMGLRNLKAAGMKCILARDLTDAHPGYDPERSFTPDGHTAEVVAHFERHLAPTVMMANELTKIGKWDHSVIVDPVRITPWGTTMRPHLFDKNVTVTLSAPWQPDAELRYTTDGTKPTEHSKKYQGPFTLTESAQLRVGGFTDGKRVCLDSEGVFCKLGEMPPAPDVPLAEAKLLRNVGHGHSYAGEIRTAPHTNPAQKDKSNEGHPLRLRGTAYRHGYGVHAPNQLMFALQPNYERFVALAGVDERLLDVASGSNQAMHPSVIFKVFIDGHEAASSPVMRIAFQPWRFDVKIPPGSRVISLTTMDAGNGNKEDMANWVDCGFVVK